MNMKKQIENTLSSILYEKLYSVGRAGDMVWLCFGEPVSYYRKEEKVTNNRFALHIQDGFRLRNNKKIIVSSQDIYI